MLNTAHDSCFWAGSFKASLPSFTLGAAQQFLASSSKTRREQGVSTPGEGIELLIYFSEFYSHGRCYQGAWIARPARGDEGFSLQPRQRGNGEIGGVCCGESPEPLAGEHGGEGPRFLFHLRGHPVALPHGVYLRLAWPTVCWPPVTIQSLIGSVTASEKHVTCHKVPRCPKAWDLGRQAVREQ